MLRHVIGKASNPTYPQRLGHQEQKVGDGTWDIPKFVDVLCVNLVFPRRVYMHIYIYTIILQFFYNSFTIYTIYTYLFYIFTNLYILIHKSVDVYRIHIYVYVYIRIRLYTYVHTCVDVHMYVLSYL